jgi:hypothetical protein
MGIHCRVSAFVYFIQAMAQHDDDEKRWRHILQYCWTLHCRRCTLRAGLRRRPHHIYVTEQCCAPADACSSILAAGAATVQLWMFIAVCLQFALCVLHKRWCDDGEHYLLQHCCTVHGRSCIVHARLTTAHCICVIAIFQCRGWQHVKCNAPSGYYVSARGAVDVTALRRNLFENWFRA